MANPNTAAYPGALPTDTSITIATDSFSTSLVSGIDNSQTSFDVTSASGLNVPCLIRIDSELMLVEAINSNTLQTITRGFGGTIAASHSGGAPVQAYIFAHHHNQLTAEVVSIASFLGINGGNIVKVGDVRPQYVNIRAGVVQAGVASSGLSLPSANAPAPSGIVGTQTIVGALAFDKDTEETAQDQIQLPVDFTGNIDLEIVWRAPTLTTGDVVWGIQTSFGGDDDSLDPSWNTEDTTTDSASASGGAIVRTTISNVNKTGAAANDIMFFKIARKAADAGDTLNEDAQLIALRWTIRRTM